MTRTRTAGLLGCALITLALTACGGNGGDARIGGSVGGLGTGLSLSLQNNGSDTLTVTGNGTFQFATSLAAGRNYNVTVLTQPAAQVCQVANGTGSVDSSADAINSVSVACVSTSSIGGTVSGLPVGTAVTLSNGTVLLPVASNGSFAFPGLLVAGTNYQVTVATQPAGAICAVTNGTGVIGTSAVTTIAVTCG